MKIVKGFFLTEVLVFLFLFSFFSLVLMRFIATTTIILMSINKKSDHIATLTSALDWLMRDLQVFNSFSDTLIVEEDGKILTLHNQDERITWKVNEGKLVRILQRYDTALQHWKKPYSSLVAQQIEDFLVEIVHNKTTKDKIQGVICTISAQNSDKKLCQLRQAIALRNGSI